MRTTLTIAALAAGVLAVPYNKRAMVTDIDMVYVTDIVTVTAGQEDPNATPEAKFANHWGHHQWSTAEEVTTETPSSVYVAPAPTSTSEAAPAWTPATTSIYVAPTPTTTSIYVAPTTEAAPAPAAPSEDSSPSGSVSGYQDIVVYHHNIHRANHSAPDLAWDDDLAKSAADIAATCVYAHNTEMDGGGYGQNIAAGVEASNISAIITDLFYNGEEPFFSSLYDIAQPAMDFFENWGHFSQIVWKATTHVGCATQHCPGGLANVGGDVSPYFTVCNYKEAGNFAGEYGSNIGAPLGHPTANWNTGL